ncbi:MAG: tetratricopeptide repeat protein [Bacteroidales bacterium]|nr:tetratricopeptide repeat protein [Bacteroidales bacterium]
MSKKKQQIKQSEKALDAFQSTLSRTEQFIENNQKLIIYIILGIVIVNGGIIGYKNLIQKPREKEAASMVFMAEYYFEVDSFSLALEGDGRNMGFLDIIDDYSSTKAGNISKYYAGVCYMRLGQYDAAINYLKRFKSKDKMLKPISVGLIGDAYAELGDLKEAVKNYEKAAKLAENEFLSPIYLMRAGLAYESLNQYDKAVVIYEKIEKEFYGTTEQRNVEKYLERAKIKAGK